jgi:hypothetical protein
MPFIIPKIEGCLRMSPEKAQHVRNYPVRNNVRKQKHRLKYFK